MSQRPPHVAYLCMEYGLHESFPIYSGGLGVLAGDFIKSARDLKMPMVAVGLLWARGYCVQRIGADGRPYEEFPGYDASFLQDTGVRVRVRVRGGEVQCRVWMTERFNHCPLFLIEPLRHEDRWITHRLYEAGTDTRIAQEMLLGIGGVRALGWLGYPIHTYHFNEGHAVFAGIELMEEIDLADTQKHVRKLNELLIEGVDDLGGTVATPRDPNRRGAAGRGARRRRNRHVLAGRESPGLAPCVQHAGGHQDRPLGAGPKAPPAGLRGKLRWAAV